jgi:hypothetical protein
MSQIRLPGSSPVRRVYIPSSPLPEAEDNGIKAFPTLLELEFYLMLEGTHNCSIFNQTFLIMRASTASIILAVCAILAVHAAPVSVDDNASLVARELGVENAVAVKDDESVEIEARELKK